MRCILIVDLHIELWAATLAELTATTLAELTTWSIGGGYPDQQQLERESKERYYINLFASYWVCFPYIIQQLLLKYERH